MESIGPLMTAFRELALAARDRDVASSRPRAGLSRSPRFGFGSASKQIALPPHAGLHTGEIEIRDQDIGGLVVPEPASDGLASRTGTMASPWH